VAETVARPDERDEREDAQQDDPIKSQYHSNP